MVYNCSTCGKTATLARWLVLDDAMAPGIPDLRGPFCWHCRAELEA